MSSRAGKTEKSMDIGSLVRGWSRSRRQTEIKRKPERPTDSRNTANDISAIDRAAVPSIGSSVRGFDKNGIGAAIIGGNGNSFVQKAMEFLDTNSFMVAASSDMDFDIEKRTNFLKEALERAAVVDRNQTAEANFQKDFLD